MIDTLRKRILVVEDHAPLLRIIAKCLQKANYETITARTAEEALLHLAETIPDLIVSDIMLPGMNGYAFAENIRVNARTDIIPIIFLTAKDTRDDRIKGLRVGVDKYLTKPFEPDELVAAIENIFSRVRRTHARVARLPVTPTTATNTTASAASPALAEAEMLPDSDLTETEMRVAEAVSRGLSNKDIAAELGISYRTVEMHISHILQKKNLSNRVELALLIERERQAKEDQAKKDEAE
ncbi:MAG: response regulator transcription factor [Acidobacteriota bacterium]|nr:response regulator transcription factor [Acidobacteriota bacterium]